MDQQIQAQLEMLENINNNAFHNQQKDGSAEPNTSEINKLMQEMIKKGQHTSDLKVTAEYRSRGEPFQDL